MQVRHACAWLPQRQAAPVPEGTYLPLRGTGEGRPKGGKAPGREPGVSPRLYLSQTLPCELSARAVGQAGVPERPTGWPAAA